MKIMCDKCFNIVDLGDINVNLAPEVIPGTNNALLTKGVAVNCECCPNESANIILDDNIAELISLLNKKGYRTLFCCEGHNEKDSIYFKTVDNAILKIRFDEFCKKYNYNGTSMYDTVEKRIFIINYESYDMKFEILENLLKWVNSLPLYYIGISSHIREFRLWLMNNPIYHELNIEEYHMYGDIGYGTPEELKKYGSRYIPVTEDEGDK